MYLMKDKSAKCLVHTFSRLSKVTSRIFGNRTVNDIVFHLDVQCFSYFLGPCSEVGNRRFWSGQTEIPIVEKVHQERKIVGYISTDFIYVHAQRKY